MLTDLSSSAWARSVNADSVPGVKFTDGICQNDSDETMIWYLSEPIVAPPHTRYGVIHFEGESLHGNSATLLINTTHQIPFGSTVNMELCPGLELWVSLSLASHSAVKITKITIEFSAEEYDLLTGKNYDADVLVVAPAYPSSANFYLCGFVHSRVREYIAAGLKVEVAAIDAAYWFQTQYELDGVPVFKSSYADLKKLLANGKYKTIVVHFVDEFLLQIFDGYIINQKLVFICHGPETLLEYLPNKTRPYFTAELDSFDIQKATRLKKEYILKYAAKEHVTWVFVSEWLKKASEEYLNVSFKHACVINNIINEKLFPYRAKTPEMRKKILVIRKFDNICQHSIDQVVLAIRILAGQPFFQELTFDFYGDGNYFDELLLPLAEFPNVHTYRKFLPNDQISRIHAEYGIILLPSRHDAHAVAMGEAASSGVVVVGSAVTSNPDFMNEAVNHTLADPESPWELAGIIERLYRNPDEFMAISQRMSAETHARCCREKTVMQEIALLRESCAAYRDDLPLPVKPGTGTPVLTLAIPAYNIEPYIHKCLHSILNQRHANQLEILVINDGSTDNTSKIAHAYEGKYPGIIRVIDKVNGGHGSTINVGIQAATGTYFRLIDGDDWVDSENLARQVERLTTETADVVLTYASYEYTNQAAMARTIQYNSLKDGVLYQFDDLVFPGYGFAFYGPMLPTSTYRTERLRAAGFTITEKKPYVDMEFNTFTLPAINTLRFYDLDIYRYLMGRAGQTVSREVWKKKYLDHEYVLFQVLRFTVESGKLTALKQRYVTEHILAPLVDSQVFIFGTLEKYEELNCFLERLKNYPVVYEAAMKFIEQRNSDSKNILAALTKPVPEPTPQVPQPMPPIPQPMPPQQKPWFYCLKPLVPYGLVQRWRTKNK